MTEADKVPEPETTPIIPEARYNVTFGGLRHVAQLAPRELCGLPKAVWHNETGPAKVIG